MTKTRIGQRGFTIVELLIVVVVIAILAAITIVAYNGITGQARKAAIQSSLSQLARKAQVAQLSGQPVTGLSSADISADMMDYVDYRKTPDGFCASYANGEGGIESGDCEGTVSTVATLPTNMGDGIVIGHDKMLYVTAGNLLLRVNR